MKYRKIYILWLNSVKLVTNYKNEKADITAGRHLHGLSGIPHLGLISLAGRNGRGTSLPVIPRTWERPTY